MSFSSNDLPELAVTEHHGSSRSKKELDKFMDNVSRYMNAEKTSHGEDTSRISNVNVTTKMAESG